MMDSLFWFPFMAVGFGAMMIVGILISIFWIWMIVDCAQRKFKNPSEKVVWLVVVVLLGWLGALVYYLVVRMTNPRGLSTK
ncbi:hypothetical protein EXS73_01430 [Candidatus Pacearchaeota archaeon]|nr:hypothetical protein [Candidatus Pacearchaeota archaeon]